MQGLTMRGVEVAHAGFHVLGDEKREQELLCTRFPRLESSFTSAPRRS